MQVLQYQVAAQEMEVPDSKSELHMWHDYLKVMDFIVQCMHVVSFFWATCSCEVHFSWSGVVGAVPALAIDPPGGHGIGGTISGYVLILVPDCSTCSAL
jgi:hypothetical protein